MQRGEVSWVLRASCSQLAESDCHVCTQVERTWEDLCSQLLTVRQIFLYLDRSYVISASGVRSLFEMGLQLFRSHLAAHPEVRPT